MPIQVKITNGPPFKNFLFSSTIFSNHEWILSFSFEGEGHPSMEMLTILSVGRQPTEKDGDVYNFLAHCQEVRTFQHLFYAGRYNTRIREGNCTVFTQEEFIMCPVVKAMFV
jgi:hypothetical protein